jgi:hypothetical protein
MEENMPKVNKFNLFSGSSQKVDVMFLADATGSMGPAMNDVKANIVSAWNAFQTATGWNVQVGVSFYRDRSDTTPFQVLQTITANTSALQAAVNGLIADSGGDRPEGQIYALTQIASRSVSGWRPGATRIVAWFGDQPGHDPVTINGVTCTMEGAIDALLERNVQVCAFSVQPSNNLDETNQATSITNRADGVTTGAFVMKNCKQAGVVAFIFNFIQEDVP